MVQRKRKTPRPSKTATNKSDELEIVAAAAQEQVPEEAELKKNADDEKNVVIEEAEERNSEKIDMEIKILEKPVSAKKARKKNAENSAAKATNVEKVAVQPEVDEIVASESKNQQIVEVKQKSGEDEKDGQKNEEDEKDGQQNAQNVKAEQSSTQVAIVEKKCEGKIDVKVEGVVDKKVESEQKNMAKVNALQNNGLSKTQQKKLKKLERLNFLEKAQAGKINPVKIDAQQGDGLSKTQKRKRAKLERLNNKTVENKTGSMGKEETVQKKSEEMEIDGTVHKKTKKMEIDGSVQEKPMKVEVDEENNKMKHKKRKSKLQKTKKEGQVNKISKEEHKEEDNKKPKLNDVMDAIEKLLPSLNNYEISEILKLAVLKHSDLLSDIERVADRDSSRRKIHVGNLSSDTTSLMLYNVFSECGELDKCDVILDKNTHKCKGFGFVTFKSLSSALSALKNPRKIINGQQAFCSIARSNSSINPYASMLGPGGVVSPAILGPGGFVSPAILGPGGIVSPAMLGPGVSSNMLVNLDPQVVPGNFGPSNYQLTYLPK